MFPQNYKQAEVARVPPDGLSRTTSGTRTTVWEPLVYRNKLKYNESDGTS